jgi:DMSO/TMAO reductase YedYZ molybdopterin-dependent catalytic subunit
MLGGDHGPSVSGIPSRTATSTPYPDELPGRQAALAGGLAGGIALLVLLLAPLILNADGFLEAIHNGVTRYVPTSLFDAAIATFGAYAKGLLFAGICVTLIGAGALMALALQRLAGLGRGSQVWETLFVALFVILVAEVVVLPVFGQGLLGSGFRGSGAALHGPIVLAGVAYAIALVGLVKSPRFRTGARSGEVAEPGAAGMPRRAFLGRVLAALGLGALAISGFTVVARVVSAGSINRTVRTTTLAPGGFGPTPAVTPVENFYVVAKDLFPLSVDVASWRLQVSGLVDRPASYSFDQIRAMPAVAGYRTFQCISSRVTTYDQLIGNQRFRGVRVADVLNASGVQPTARFVLWQALDGYTESLPLEVARDPRTWLAYEMGPPGTLLEPEHGAPLRVIIAGRYGMKQPKWLTAIQLSDHDEDGYWEQRGWDRTAAVRVYSRIDLPMDGDSVPAGQPFAIYGIANSGDRGISRVEVSTDDGQSWQDAEIEKADPAISELTWVRWRLLSAIVAQEGRTTLVVRATDGQGNVQDPEPRPPLPSGATGFHRVAVLVLPT